MTGLYNELSVILVASCIISLLLRTLKQPLLIAYIFTGILVGPAAFNIVQTGDALDVFASIGIALLLFLVGLGLNPKVIKEVGKVALYTGVGQVIFTTLVGYFLLGLMGHSGKEALYISVALAFSSTIIVLKVFSDKKEQNRLHGKIAIGFLLIQDIMATIMLIYVSSISTSGFGLNVVVGLLTKSVAVIAVLLLTSKFILPPLKNVISGSQEFLFLFSISWGIGMGAAFQKIGFSVEIGALAAGISLAGTSYASEIATKLKPLRDFFIVLFFVSLGTHLKLDNVLNVLPKSIILSVFVLIGNPLIMLIIMGMLGYTKKTSFKTSLAVGQVSEFSLVLLLLANRLNQVSDDVLSLVTVVGLITIAGSTYMMMYDEKLYNALQKYISLFEKRKTKNEHIHKETYDVIVLGYKKGGAEFIKTLQKIKKQYVVIDYDPESVDELHQKDIPYIYGDATEIELFEEIDLSRVKMVISSLTSNEINLGLIEAFEKQNSDIIFICKSDSFDEAEQLYEKGASYVILPHIIGSEKLSSFITKNGISRAEFKKYRKSHMQIIENSQ